MNTGAGRALVAGALFKVIAFAVDLLPRPFSLAHDLIDTVGDILIIGGAVLGVVRLFRGLRMRLLWRVRRKLILSYIFIGVVPALLIITFFLLSGLLMFYNVSAYLMQARVNALAQEARSLAQSAAFELEGSRTPAQSSEVLARRQRAVAAAYPGVSFAAIPTPTRCAGSPGNGAPISAGDWAHLAAPATVPEWVPCDGFAGLIAYNGADPSDGLDAPRRTRLVARAMARSDDAQAPSVVIVDVPVSDAVAQRLRQDSGIAIGQVTPLNRSGSTVSPLDPEPRDDRAGAPQPQLPTIGIAVRTAEGGSGEGGLLERPLEWVSLLDYTDWNSGEIGAVAVAIRMSIADLYTRVSASPIERIGNISFGQLLLIGLALVGISFLVIQSVALAMGMTLAKSITGSVHELFAGTERVRRGDFTHKIAIRSRDQLGELAESFNSMTASIEDLLQQKAEKERLAEELRIARQIQMSLLPQGQLQVPGLALIGHCEPAREVGGDYYDFLPLGDGRLGVLIADVAGKGTSAALYMAELKGLVLSLSRHHRSPRQLLIDANQIIAPHLDDSSFITMTYAVVDQRARTLTYARAGHCPMIYRPGPSGTVRPAQTMTPDGMVLGLKFDQGETFARILEEAVLPLVEGDLFMLFTDGLTEAMNLDGDCFGDARLTALVEEHGDGPPEQLRERILREIQAFTGPAAQHDDMTMLVVKVEGGAAGPAVVV